MRSDALLTMHPGRAYRRSATLEMDGTYTGTLVEIFFGYAIARRFFSERISRIEIAGMLLLFAGLVVVTLAR